MDVGVGGVLRRLGLGTLAARAGENLIAFGDVHLASERGHVVQLGAPRSAVHHLDARGSRLWSPSSTPTRRPRFLLRGVRVPLQTLSVLPSAGR